VVRPVPRRQARRRVPSRQSEKGGSERLPRLEGGEVVGQPARAVVLGALLLLAILCHRFRVCPAVASTIPEPKHSVAAAGATIEQHQLAALRLRLEPSAAATVVVSDRGHVVRCGRGPVAHIAVPVVVIISATGKVIAVPTNVTAVSSRAGAAPTHQSKGGR